MEEDAQGAADRRGQIRRKISDIAAILPILGVILFASPLIFAMTGDDGAALPYAALSIFLVWGGLIAATFALSRFLKGDAGRK